MDVVGLLIMAGLPAYLLLQLSTMLAWRGHWRRWALLPLLLTVPALLFSLFALYDGSNLWPLTLIFAAAIGAAYLAILLAARIWLA